MKWQEIRTYFPQQWLLVKVIQARSESNRRILEHLAVIGVFDDLAAAESSRQQLLRQAPWRDLYVFHASQETLDVAAESIRSPSVDKRDIDKPTGVKIASTRDGLRISWNHLGDGAAFTTVFWLLFFVGVIIRPDDTWSFLYKFRIPLAMLVLSTFYYFLIGLNNEMVVQVDQDTLTISWEGPIPCLYLGQTFPSTNIRQVYIKYLRLRSSFTYEIYILTMQGQHKKFASVSDGELALYLEQEIERFLGIEDQAVCG